MAPSMKTTSRARLRDDGSTCARERTCGRRGVVPAPPWESRGPVTACAHLWVRGAHAGQHGRKHVPALVPRPAAHGQLEQVHQDTGVVRDQQTGELIQGQRFWA